MPGSVYNALAVPASTPVITDIDRQAILDVLCCFYDFSGNKPSSNCDLKDAWERAQETPDEMRQMYWPTDRYTAQV